MALGKLRLTQSPVSNRGTIKLAYLTHTNWREAIMPGLMRQLKFGPKTSFWLGVSEEQRLSKRIWGRSEFSEGFNGRERGGTSPGYNEEWGGFILAERRKKPLKRSCRKVGIHILPLLGRLAEFEKKSPRHLVVCSNPTGEPDSIDCSQLWVIWCFCHAKLDAFTCSLVLHFPHWNVHQGTIKEHEKSSWRHNLLQLLPFDLLTMWCFRHETHFL